MDIRDWDPANVSELASVYNAEVAVAVPHCYAILPDAFDTGRYERTGDDYQALFRSDRVFVGTMGKGLYISEDGGKTFVFDGIENGSISAIKIEFF